ncbi:MAG: hypothetical protein HQK64_03240, partial [Desulfamplus sp.]|nr:hypothetical protein [Desulfamplus sp.]
MDNKGVAKYNLTSGAQVYSWGVNSSNVMLYQPKGIAIDSTNQKLFIADGIVKKFNFYGNSERIGVDPNPAYIPSNSMQPSYFAIDSDGNFYVPDSTTTYSNNNDLIKKFDNAGNFIKQWGSQGSGDGQFNNIAGIAVSDGYVYVVDAGNYRVQKFDTDGVYKAQWGSQGVDDGKFGQVNPFNPFGISKPGIAVSDGFVYVVDTGNHRVQKFDTDGEYKAQWGSQGVDDGKFRDPSGIAIEHVDIIDGGVCIGYYLYIYVADTNNNRIQKFVSHCSGLDNNGKILSGEQWEFASEGVFVQQFGWALSEPFDVKVYSGTTFVTDSRNKINKFGLYYSDWEPSGTTSKAIIVAG